MPVSPSEWRVRIGTFVHWIRENEVKVRRKRLLKKRIRRMKVLCKKVEAKRGDSGNDSGKESEDDKSRQDGPDPKGCPHKTVNILSSGNTSDIKALLTSCDQCIQDLLTASDSHIKEILTPSGCSITELVTPNDCSIKSQNSRIKTLVKADDDSRIQDLVKANDDSRILDLLTTNYSRTCIRHPITSEYCSIKDVIVSKNAGTKPLDTLNDSSTKELTLFNDSSIKNLITPNYSRIIDLITSEYSNVKDLITSNDSKIDSLLSPNETNIKWLIKRDDGYIGEQLAQAHDDVITVCTSDDESIEQDTQVGDSEEQHMSNFSISQRLSLSDASSREVQTPTDDLNADLIMNTSYIKDHATQSDGSVKELSSRGPGTTVCRPFAPCDDFLVELLKPTVCASTDLPLIDLCCHEPDRQNEPFSEESGKLHLPYFVGKEQHPQPDSFTKEATELLKKHQTSLGSWKKSQTETSIFMAVKRSLVVPIISKKYYISERFGERIPFRHPSHAGKDFNLLRGAVQVLVNLSQIRKLMEEFASTCRRPSLKSKTDLISRQIPLSELLLLKSGDVEQNPGPLGAAGWRVVLERELLSLVNDVALKHYTRLCNALDVSYAQSQLILTQNEDVSNSLFEVLCSWVDKQRDGTNYKKLLAEKLRSANLDALGKKLVEGGYSTQDTPTQASVTDEVHRVNKLEEEETLYRTLICKIKTDPPDFDFFKKFENIYTRLLLLRNEMGKTELDYNELLRLNSENISPYINSYFGDGNMTGAALITFMEDNDVIKMHMARFPIYLHIICIKWKESTKERQEVICESKTFSQLFQQMMTHLKEHYISNSCNTLTTKSIDKFLMEIGEIAFYGLLNKCLTFNENVFSSCEEAVDVCSKIGVLNREKRSVLRVERAGTKIQPVTFDVSFPHKLFQEYVAALYLAALYKSNYAEYTTSIKKISEANVHEFEYLLYFTSSQGQGVGKDIIDRLDCEDDFLVDVAFEAYDVDTGKIVGQRILTKQKSLEIDGRMSSHTLSGYLFIMKQHAMKPLILSGRKFGPTVSRGVADALSSPTSLTTLTLSKTTFHDNFYKFLSDHVSESKRGEPIDAVRELHIDHWFINGLQKFDTTIEALFPRLIQLTFTTLQTVSLGVVKRLAHSSLLKLFIEHGGEEEKLVPLIGEPASLGQLFSGSFPILHSLTFREVVMGKKRGEAILCNLKNHQYLKSISIISCFTDDELDLLAEQIRTEKGMKIILRPKKAQRTLSFGSSIGPLTIDMIDALCHRTCVTHLAVLENGVKIADEEYFPDLHGRGVDSKIVKLCIDGCNLKENDRMASRYFAKFLCLLPILTDLTMKDSFRRCLHDDFYRELALLASSSKIQNVRLEGWCLENNDHMASRNLARFLCNLPCLTDYTIKDSHESRLWFSEDFYQEIVIEGPSSKNHFFNKKLHLDERLKELKGLDLEERITYVRHLVHPTLSEKTSTCRANQPPSLHQRSVQQQIEYPSFVTPPDLDVPSTSGINPQSGKIPKAQPPSVNQSLQSRGNVGINAADSSLVKVNTLIGQQNTINLYGYFHSEDDPSTKRDKNTNRKTDSSDEDDRTRRDKQTMSDGSKGDSIDGRPRKRTKNTNQQTDSSDEDGRTRGDKQTMSDGSKGDSIDGRPRKRKKKTNRQTDSSDEEGKIEH